MGCSSTNLKDLKPIIITSLNHVFDCDFKGKSIILLKDQRIASHNGKNKIFIYSLNIKTKKWNLDFVKKIISEGECETIYSICQLDNEKLVTTYHAHIAPDQPFKRIEEEDEEDDDDGFEQMNIHSEFQSFDRVHIWKLTKDQFILEQKIQLKVLIMYAAPITNGFALYCPLNEIQIFKEKNNSYEIDMTLEDVGDGVCSLIQLRNKKEIVTTGVFDKTNKHIYDRFISFWDSKSYQKKYTIMGYGAISPKQMVELYDEKIAVSCDYSQVKPDEIKKDSFIILIDPTNYNILKKIESKELITHGFELFPLDYFSFVAVKDGMFLQISSKQFEIVYSEKSAEEYSGSVIVILERQYVVIQNERNKQFSVFKILSEEKKK